MSISHLILLTGFRESVFLFGFEALFLNGLYFGIVQTIVSLILATVHILGMVYFNIFSTNKKYLIVLAYVFPTFPRCSTNFQQISNFLLEFPIFSIFSKNFYANESTLAFQQILKGFQYFQYVQQISNKFLSFLRNFQYFQCFEMILHDIALQRLWSYL